ncbi:MAG TPA: hypothetical protein VLW53_24570 [Candidatus Eisenbacteria bacterium]|nr:hypothetical protein [Candidatus Eisenbacteria bacterium]
MSVARPPSTPDTADAQPAPGGRRRHALQVPNPVYRVTARLSGRPVLLVGAGMVLIQLVVRTWALFGSWFQFDDFSFMSRVMNHRLGWDMLLEPYAGHVMPAGFLLSWANAQVDPLNFNLPAATLFTMQVLASVGCLALLIHAFGERWGILLPLGVYLFSIITLPAFIWWAAGVNQMPLQVAFFWGLYAHLSYLRTRRFRYAVITMALVLMSLAFYEKTLLLFAVFAILALGYFATGDIADRLVSVWRRYRPAVVLYFFVALAYIVFYAVWGLNFNPSNANDQPLGPVVMNLAGKSFATGILGGPLRWDFPNPLFEIPDPSEIATFVSWVVLSVMVLELARTRKRSKRAWLIPAWFVAADVLLVTAGRAFLVGPQIALDYRYQTELAGAATFALGLALMPLRGARESAELVRPSAFFDRPWRVGAATVAIVALALVSTGQYVTHWQSARQSRSYFAAVDRDLRWRQTRVPMVDASVPDYLMWAFGYPDNTYSHMLRMFSAHTRYPKISADSLYMIDLKGRVKPVVIPAVRRNLPGPDGACGYRLGAASTTIPLNGPVIGGGWWLRIGYYSDAATPVTITFGEQTYKTALEKGLHSLYLEASGQFSLVTISGLQGTTSGCTNDVTLGLPQPFPLP